MSQSATTQAFTAHISLTGGTTITILRRVLGSITVRGFSTTQTDAIAGGMSPVSHTTARTVLGSLSSRPSTPKGLAQGQALRRRERHRTQSSPGAETRTSSTARSTSRSCSRSAGATSGSRRTRCFVSRAANRRTSPSSSSDAPAVPYSRRRRRAMGIHATRAATRSRGNVAGAQSQCAPSAGRGCRSARCAAGDIFAGRYVTGKSGPTMWKPPRRAPFPTSHRLAGTLYLSMPATTPTSRALQALVMKRSPVRVRPSASEV